MFVDSLSKTHGVTGLRTGAILTRSDRLSGGVIRYSQNIMAGPSCAMQAVMLALLAPFATGDRELAEHRIRLQLRIGRHLQRRRRLLLEKIFDVYGEFLDADQPLLPDPVGFDWEGSMYADLQLSAAVPGAGGGQGSAADGGVLPRDRSGGRAARRLLPQPQP